MKKEVKKVVHMYPEPIFKEPNSDYMNSIIMELEKIGNEIDIKKYLRWASRELAVGFTPLIEIPEKLNPYARNGMQILYKPEYLNHGGSGKGRAVSFMLYYYMRKGLLDGIKTITTAGFGNFIRTLMELIPSVNPNITPKAHMGRILGNENLGLVKHLIDNGTVIAECDDDYCPTGNMDRGAAIANAYIEEQTDPAVLMFDQHAIFKPFDGLLNAAGYFYGLAPEILFQTNGVRNLYYVNGEGTRGSLVGTATGIKRARPEAKIIALRQEEGAHIFGLRAKNQLGKSDSLGGAEELCDAVYEISDREAYVTMLKLWDAGIPATPSGGSYIAGALRLAENLRGNEGTIITLIFDSLEFYKNILEIWIPTILGYEFNLEIFEHLKAKAYSEREEHRKKIRSGRNELYHSMGVEF